MRVLQGLLQGFGEGLYKDSRVGAQEFDQGPIRWALATGTPDSSSTTLNPPKRTLKGTLNPLEGTPKAFPCKFQEKVWVAGSIGYTAEGCGGFILGLGFKVKS